MTGEANDRTEPVVEPPNRVVEPPDPEVEPPNRVVEPPDPEVEPPNRVVEPVETTDRAKRPGRTRMTAATRRAQLMDIARGLFGERGFDGASIEEIAARAEVSKPVVYEHFGGKEGLYAAVVDREVRCLLDLVRTALTAGEPRMLLEQAAFALLDYIEQFPDGFRILVRDSPVGSASGSFVSIIGDVASRVEYILAAEFEARGFDRDTAPLYAQMLVGMVGAAGQWWLDARAPSKDQVAAHLVNLAWHGLAGLHQQPSLRSRPQL